MSTGLTSTPRVPGALQGISLLMPITLSVMAALFVAPMIPRMMQYFAAVPHAGVLIGMVVTIPSLCVALFSPHAGALGDRFGRRRLLILSMAVYSAVGILPYFLDNLYLILASRFVVGMVEAMLMTLSTKLIADYFTGPKRDRWLAAQTGVASTTAIVVLMIAGAVGQYDWHNVFLLYLIPLLFLAMVLLFTWEPKESLHLQDPGAHLGWGQLPWKLLGQICAITLFGSVMFYVVQIQLSSALHDLGVTLPNGDYDAARGANLTALASLFVPVGTVCFWWLSPRASLGIQFLIEFTLLGAGFLLMGRITNPTTFALSAGLDQIGAGMLLPTLLTWALRKLPFEVRGRGTGIWTSTFALGQFVSTVIVVPGIMSWTRGILSTFSVLGWACLAAALVSLWKGARSRSSKAPISA